MSYALWRIQMPKILKKNKLVIIQEEAETLDPQTGEPLPGWGAFATPWMSCEPMTGNERALAQQTIAVGSHRFKCWYIAGVTAKMRLSMDGRHFNIKSVINIEEANRELIIMADEVDA
jgi:SPP1 family predicted phage head-tail adaptor